MISKLWCIQQTDLFASLSAKELEEVHHHFVMKKYRKREVIYEPGDKDRIFIVETGRVELYQLTPSGKKVIIEVLKPGGIFGDLGAESNIETFVEASEDSQICSMDKEAFFDLISQYPAVSSKIMKGLFNRLVNVENRLSSLAADNAMQKLAKLFLSLGKQQQEEDYMVVTENHTHEELSQMLGISRQTVTTLINQMEKKSLIQRSGKTICFQPAVLEELAQ